jgi:hypothetical protein
MSAAARATINRENAQSSTGPRTSAGKERSSRNSLVHGLTSKTVVLPHENAEEYEAMHRGLLEAYKPANDNEKVLVEHVVQAYWRLQRCYGVERAFLDNRIAASEDQDPEMAMANLFIDKAESARMRLLMRYLGSAERAYNKALADLQKAQTARRKEEREQAADQHFREIYAQPGFVSYTPQTTDDASPTLTAPPLIEQAAQLTRAA